MSTKFDTRLLAWGGFLGINEDKSEKNNRWILTINIPKQEIIIIQHEQEFVKYPFNQILCTFSNLKHETALMIFWENAKPALQFFFDSIFDRDSVQKILQSIPQNKSQQTATTIGSIPDFETTCDKRGKMKSAPRYIILIKSRILIFRNNTSIYPLQMISLLEPNIQIEVNIQDSKTINIYAQEKNTCLKLKSSMDVKQFVEKLNKNRIEMNNKAKSSETLEKMKLTESKRNMLQKSMRIKNEYESKLAISSRIYNPNANTDSMQYITLKNGAKMSFRINNSQKTDFGIGGINSMKRPGKKIKFNISFKPEKHKADIFMFGKARPPQLFPQQTSSVIPFKHNDLSNKRFILINTAKDGMHCIGITKNNWSFVWGECDFNGGLGLGPTTKSTVPFLLRPLKKMNIVDIACSARHGIAVSFSSKVFGWGMKMLTGLQFDTQEPQPLLFLDNLGILAVDCCGTHSVAYSSLNCDVYQFGMTGAWLGLSDMSKTFGKVKFNLNSFQCNKTLAVIKVCVANEYSMYLFSNGEVFTSGINEHGRMGCSNEISEINIPIKVHLNELIGEISCGPFHCGFISFKNKLFTCGVGKNYRLGHNNENNYYKPTLVENLLNVKCARVECVGDRTYVITKYGAVLMFGVEPVTQIIYKKPFVFEFLTTHRIYQICGTKDFTIALGVKTKDEIMKPNIESDHNIDVDTKMGDYNYNNSMYTAVKTINKQNVIGNKQKINTVINPQYAQSSGLYSMNNMAKPLPDIVPVTHSYNNNNNYGPPPPPPPTQFGGF